MRSNEYHRKKRSVKFLSPSSILSVFLYLAILTGVVVFALVPEKQTGTETFGSLEGRFTSDIKMIHRGKMVHYRENEITNYLLIGVDNENLEVGSYQNGGQADFLLMLSVDRRNRTITPVMIDRDTMTQVSTYGVFGNPAGERQMQICLAQAFSGRDVTSSRNTASAVTNLLGGVKVNHYVTMDISGIALLNDTMGGVTVTLEDDLTALDPLMKKGETILLKGEMAEHFVRGRMTVADGTNAARMRRQRTYLEALLDQFKAKMEGNAAFLEQVFETLSGHLESDASDNVLLSDVNAYYGYNWKELKTLPGAHRVGDDGFTEFWPEKQTFEDMIVDVWFN